MAEARRRSVPARLRQLLLFRGLRVPEPPRELEGGEARGAERGRAERDGSGARGRPVAWTAQERAALREGVRELRAFVRESGGAHVGAPRLRGRHVTIPIVARDGETYHLRIAVDRYLVDPPRCSFVDAAGRPTPGAWPSNEFGGPFRSPHFICTPPTAEFYRAHSDRRYRPEEGTLVNAVATVLAALRAPEYGGRYDPARPRRRGHG